MSAPLATASVEAVLNYASIDRDFANALNRATQRAVSVAERNLQGITDAASDVVSDVDRVFGRTDIDLDTDAARRGLGDLGDEAARAARRAREELNDVDEATDEVGRGAREAGEGFGELAGQMAGAAAGLLGGAAAMDTLFESFERADLGNKLAAQLNLTADESAEAGKIAGGLYAQNYGESFEQVNEATGAVLSSLGNLADDGAPAIEALTAKALTLNSVFGIETAEAAQTANAAIRNGLAPDASTAFDLIGTAMQRVPAQMRDELIPIIDEYGVNLNALGFTGEEAFGLVVNAAQNGAIGMDKAGDAIKEFGIRATDLGDTGAQEALTALGFSGQDMANRLLAGGDVAQGAFQEIVAGLQGIEDPAEQAAAATALFGTPLEDLDKSKIPGFLTGLTNAGSAMADFSGSVDAMGATISEGPGASLELLKREIQTTLIDAMGTASQFVMENQNLVLGLGIAVGTLAGTFVAVKVAMAAWTVATQIWAGVQAVATAAQWAWNAALSANPIGIIIVAVAALVAALVYFFTQTETGKAIIAAVWSFIQSAISAAWGVIKTVWDAMVSAFQAVGGFFSSVWSGVIKPVWDALVAVAQYVWATVLQPIFQNIGVILGWLGDAFSMWWNGVVKPVWDALGAAINWVYSSVIQPVFSGIEAAFTFVGGVISAWWNSTVKPVWDAFGNAISWVADNVVQPAIDRVTGAFESAKGIIGGAIDGIKGFFESFGTVASGVWDTVMGGLRKVVHGIGGFLQKVPTKIGPLSVPGGQAARDLGDALVGFAGGGPVFGKGTGTSDSILAWLSNGEYVIPALGVNARTMPLLDALRSGWVPSAAFLANMAGKASSGASALAGGDYNGDLSALGVEEDNPMIAGMLGARSLIKDGDFTGNLSAMGIEEDNPIVAAVLGLKNLFGFAEGGLVSADSLNEFAMGLEGQPYVWGGVNWGDCSGAMSALANFATGRDAFGSRFATGSEEGELAARGFLPGLGPEGSFNIGWYNGGPYGGHTAGTLPNGTNVEMGGARGDGQYGGGAVGADWAEFTDHAHLPPEFFIGGDDGPAAAGLDYSGGGGAATPSVAAPSSSGGGTSSMPSGGGGSSGGSAPSSSGGSSGGSAPKAYGPGMYGVDAANAWAADQDFPTQAADWGKDALKEIGGEFFAPLGLDGLFGKGVDNAAAQLAAARTGAAGGDGKLADTIVFQGMDPQKAMDEARRMLEDRMAAVTGRFRNGG